MLGAGECKIGNCSRDAAIPVIERMNRHEPQMCKTRFQHGVDVSVLVEPVNEGFHLMVQPPRCWRLEVNTLAPDRTGDHLHRASLVVTPRTDADFAHTRAARWEQRRVPS